MKAEPLHKHRPPPLTDLHVHQTCTPDSESAGPQIKPEIPPQDAASPTLPIPPLPFSPPPSPSGQCVLVDVVPRPWPFCNGVRFFLTALRLAGRARCDIPVSGPRHLGGGGGTPTSPRGRPPQWGARSHTGWPALLKVYFKNCHDAIFPRVTPCDSSAPLCPARCNVPVRHVLFSHSHPTPVRPNVM